MTKISNKETAYKIKSPINGTDYFPITNSLNLGVGLAKGATKSADFDGVRDFILSGLAPEVGGTLKITEIEIASLNTDIATTVNSILPVYIVSQYELVFFKVSGIIYLLKSQDLTIGLGQMPLANSDFILFPVSVGPQGVPGTNGTNGTNAVEVNLQKVINVFPYAVLSTDDKHTLFIENNLANVVINFPTNLPSNFCASIVQKGIGDVTIISAGTLLFPSTLQNVLKNRYSWVLVEKELATSTFYLIGNLKTV